MANINDIIKKATPVERTIHVCVGGKLYAEYEELIEKMRDIENDPLKAGRLSGNRKDSGEKDLLAEKDRLEKELAESTFPFRFRSASPKVWSDLITAHAQPDGSLDMQGFGIAAIAATCYDPEGMDDVEAVKSFLENLSPAQQGDLTDAAWEVNTTVPKGRNFSAA